MASFDVAKLINKITQDIPGLNTVIKALANWDVSALSDVPDGAMQATTDANNRLTIKKKISGAYAPVAKLMHDVDKLDGYHASTSATANAIPVRNASGALPGNILGNAVTADTATALAAGSVVPVNQGGTGATTASQARANLGVADGADFATHIAKQASPTVEGHVKLDALAADGSNTAAPGGYGLGKATGKTVTTTLNTCLEGGFYNLPSYPQTAITDVAFPSIGTGPMLVVPRGNLTTQFYFCSGSFAYRQYNTSTGVWSNFTVIPKGITDSTATTSSTIAASATAVKTAYDRAQQVATASISGGVKVGDGIDVSGDGMISVPIADTTKAGIVQPDGTSITVDVSGKIAATPPSTSRADKAASYKSDGTSTTTGFAIADGTDLATLFGKLDTAANATSGTGTFVSSVALSVSGKKVTLTQTKGTPGYCSYCSYCGYCSYCSYCAYGNNN